MSIESSDAIQSSHPLPLPSPLALNLSQHQGCLELQKSALSYPPVPGSLWSFKERKETLFTKIWWDEE